MEIKRYGRAQGVIEVNGKMYPMPDAAAPAHVQRAWSEKTSRMNDVLLRSLRKAVR